MEVREMGKCSKCGRVSPEISKEIGFCRDCLREKFPGVPLKVKELWLRTRKDFDLPPQPPCTREGILCGLCENNCRLGEGEKGWCGIRWNEGGELKGATEEKGWLDFYYDPLPTNCVADWVCAGGTGAGYPRYAHLPGPEYGWKNLAVFYHGCSFNCLFCQNWHWRDRVKKTVSPQELLEAVDGRTSCICFFGGDPSSQILHSLKTSRLILKKWKGEIMRICWETNGSMNPSFLEEMAEIALESGGCIKFDLKAWDEKLHLTLCGVSNKRTLENFSRLSSFFKKRPEPPFLVVSTLLIPGYVDEREVRGISRFISELDPRIPYSLLAFYPQFYLSDLPTTSRRLAERSKEVAQEEGLKRVRIGNPWLLS